MKLLICIDDTDNLDSPGTGELLEDMTRAMEEAGLARGGFVTRHQLLLDESIDYTSHNSAMCCEAEGSDPAAVVRFAGQYLEQYAAEGSDPGLCVLIQSPQTDYSRLTEFGRAAQQRVLSMEEAVNTAALWPGKVFLSAHGGTGAGIIGALAGTGLRLTGEDGKLKGKIGPETEGEILTCAEFRTRYKVDRVVDSCGKELPAEAEIHFLYRTKADLSDGRVTVTAEAVDGFWVPCRHLGGGRKR